MKTANRGAAARQSTKRMTTIATIQGVPVDAGEIAYSASRTTRTMPANAPAPPRAAASIPPSSQRMAPA